MVFVADGALAGRADSASVGVDERIDRRIESDDASVTRTLLDRLLGAVQRHELRARECIRGLDNKIAHAVRLEHGTIGASPDLTKRPFAGFQTFKLGNLCCD